MGGGLHRISQASCESVDGSNVCNACEGRLRGAASLAALKKGSHGWRRSSRCVRDESMKFSAFLGLHCGCP
jgi:hypothetical protein